MRTLWANVSILMLLAATSVQAHEMRPAYVRITESSGGELAITFRQPIVNDRFMNLQLVTGCDPLTEKRHQLSAGALTQTWTEHCTNELAEISLPGLARTLTDVLVELEQPDGSMRHYMVKPGHPVLVLADKATPLLPVYLRLGITHLLEGLDHMLFIIALVLLITDRWKLVGTITAFTVAHSVTLVLSTMDLVRVPQAPVEAVIALTILFVAVELTKPGDAFSITRRHPWLVAFSFGLLHGLGFAGVLGEIGLPPGEEAWALVLFNLGIEVGQLLVIALVLACVQLLGAISRQRDWSGRTPQYARLVPAYIIGPIAVSWILARVPL